MYYADTSHSNNAGLSPYGIPLEAKHTHTTYRHTAATVVKKVKYMDIVVRSLTCHTAMGTHMPYRITLCYLPLDRATFPPLPQPKLVLD